MRTQPYSAIGIRRVACARCGSTPSHASWNICADKIGGRKQFRALCKECDIAMNEIAMRFVFGATREADLSAYAEKLRV